MAAKASPVAKAAPKTPPVAIAEEKGKSLATLPDATIPPFISPMTAKEEPTDDDDKDNRKRKAITPSILFTQPNSAGDVVFDSDGMVDLDHPIKGEKNDEQEQQQSSSSLASSSSNSESTITQFSFSQAIRSIQDQQQKLMAALGMAGQDFDELTSISSNPTSIVRQKPTATLAAAAKRHKEKVKKQQAKAKADKKVGKKTVKTKPPPLGRLELPDTFEAHGLVWERNMPTTEVNSYIGHHRWSLDSTNNSERLYDKCHENISVDLWWYFFQVFPMKHLKDMVRLTNRELAKRNDNVSGDIDQQEMLKFFGIVLLIPHMPLIPRRDMWMTEPNVPYGAIADLGRTGMSRHRFEAILASIRFSEQRDEKPSWLSDQAYRWTLVDDFIQAINTHREHYFEPSGTICVDESMVRWYGLGGSWISMGLPHFVQIDRKPDDGCEIQDACCAESGILCRLSIVKHEADENNKKTDDTGNVGTNTVIKLTQPWHKSGRIIVGDSAFSSVNTAVQLHKLKLGYIGVVKQATKYYPMEPFQRTILPEKGQYVGMTTTVDNATIMAYVWSDRDRRFFVSTAGSMEEGAPYERIRWREVGDEGGERKAERVHVAVPMPKATEKYFDAANMIDHHNRIHEECGIDKRFRTNDWAIRVNFAILAMLFTDTWLLYKACKGEKNKHSPRTFFQKLATELIDIDIDGKKGTTTRQAKRQKVENTIVTIKHLEQGRTKQRRKGAPNHARQMRCSICTLHTTTVCLRCSNSRQGNACKEVFVCCISKGGKCWEKHKQLFHG